MENVKKYSTTNLFKKFYFLAKPYKRFIIIFILASTVNTFVNISEGFLVKNIINSAIEKNKGNIVELTLVMAIIVFTGAILNYVMKYVYGLFSANSMSDFRVFLYKHFQKLPLECFNKNHSGDILSRFSNDASAMQNFIGSDLLNMILDCLMIVAASIYMATMSWKLLLFSIMLSPIAIIFINIMANYTKKYSKTGREFVGKANSVIQDSISGIFMVKSFNLKKELIGNFERESNEALKFALKETFLSSCNAPFHVTLRMIPTVMCITFGAFLSIKNEITPGELMAFLYLLGYVSWPLAFLTDRITNLKSSAGAMERVAEVLDWQIERNNGSDFEVNSCSDAVQIKNLSFCYKEDIKAIDNLSLSIEKGKKIAVVGTSGCGKSTLIKLICGFYENFEGSIEVAGQDINKTKLDSMREHISLVTQDTYLFPESVMENIAHGRKNASMEDIINAAKVANAYDFIMALSEGFQTQVGERGVKLSGGQKQRIALARAVLKNASLILLDEPTSALDTESETLVQEAMDRIIEGKTAIVVAHRFSTIKNADEILVMEKGTLVERGSHEQLISMGGTYTQLYEKQFIK
jgi:ABC-type multidrug transport system fused ATPase/permease subunit